MVGNPAHEIYRASAGAVGCATHQFVKSPDDLDAFGADVSGDFTNRWVAQPTAPALAR